MSAGTSIAAAASPRPAPATVGRFAPPDGWLLLGQHVAAIELLQQRHHHAHGALCGRIVQVLLCTHEVWAAAAVVSGGGGRERARPRGSCAAPGMLLQRWSLADLQTAMQSCAGMGAQGACGSGVRREAPPLGAPFLHTSRSPRTPRLTAARSLSGSSMSRRAWAQRLACKRSRAGAVRALGCAGGASLPRQRLPVLTLAFTASRGSPAMPRPRCPSWVTVCVVS